MKIVEFFNGLKRKKNGRPETEIYNGSLCVDEMSTWYPVDYANPDIIRNFLSNGEEIVSKKIQTMNTDEFNDSFLDNYIDKLINIGLADIEDQRIRHQRALMDIRLGQQSKLTIYRKKLIKIEDELEKLREEILA